MSTNEFPRTILYGIPPTLRAPHMKAREPGYYRYQLGSIITCRSSANLPCCLGTVRLCDQLLTPPQPPATDSQHGCTVASQSPSTPQGSTMAMQTSELMQHQRVWLGSSAAPTGTTGCSALPPTPSTPLHPHDVPTFSPRPRPAVLVRSHAPAKPQ